MMEDPAFGRMIGKLIGPCLVLLLGALVAYAVQRERQRSKNDTRMLKDKPSFLREVRDRLKDPNKPTGR
jgi:hypothetical protein